MFSYAKKSKLVEKYTSLVELFPLNGSLQNDVDQLKSVEVKKEAEDPLLRCCESMKTTSIWKWFLYFAKVTKVYISKVVIMVIYGNYDSVHLVGKILDECIDSCKVINLFAGQLFEFRKEIGTRPIHIQEERLLSSMHTALLAFSRFLESCLNDDEVSLSLLTHLEEKRPDFRVDNLNLIVNQFDKNDTFKMVKHVELLLNLSELTACATLEFGFRIVYSEMTRTQYKSHCCQNFFFKMNKELSTLRQAIQDSWNEYNAFLNNESEETVENDQRKEPFNMEIPAAVRYTREYKLWKNATEMNRIGAEVLPIFKSIATSAEFLVNRVNPESDDTAYNSSDYNGPEECQLHIQSLMKDSNVMLSRLVRLSCVNEEILNDMFRVKNEKPKTTAGNYPSFLNAKEASDKMNEVELSDSEIIVKGMDEYGEEESDIYSIKVNPLKQSEKFEVYQLQERPESDDETDNADFTCEWEPKVNEVKATHNFVMSELKQVLVGVKDVMSKRENEAFIEKYGAHFTDQHDSTTKYDEDTENGISPSNSQDSSPVNTLLRRRTLMPNPFSAMERNDLRDVSSSSQINLMLHRPNFAPLKDEYIINDTGSESESE